MRPNGRAVESNRCAAYDKSFTTTPREKCSGFSLNFVPEKCAEYCTSLVNDPRAQMSVDINMLMNGYYGKVL